MTATPPQPGQTHPAPARPTPALRRAGLLCGVLAFLLYVATDALSARRFQGYSYRSQTISELSAVGVPTRRPWIAMGIAWNLLTLAAGLAVRASAAGRRPLTLAGALIAALGLVGFAWPFAPMHQRKVLAAGGATRADTVHLVLASIDSAIALPMLAIGSAALGAPFRLYSAVTFACVALFGAYTALQRNRVGADQPTPWLGIAERIAAFGPMLWIAVLSTALLRRQPPQPHPPTP